MKKKNKKNSHKTLIIFSVLLVVFLVLTVYYILNVYKKTNTNSISYSKKSNINYAVCLKENSYFDERCLKSGRTYVSDIIDYIDIDFSYLTSFSNKLKTNYSYNITSEILATNKEDSSKIVYDKRETLYKENYK